SQVANHRPRGKPVPWLAWDALPADGRGARTGVRGRRSVPGRASGRSERGILGAARATHRVPSHRCYVPRMTGRARPSRRRPRRVLRWVLLGVAALVLAAAALLARDVVAARDAFAAVVDDLPDAEDALLDGDLDSYEIGRASCRERWE